MSPDCPSYLPVISGDSEGQEVPHNKYEGPYGEEHGPALPNTEYGPALPDYIQAQIQEVDSDSEMLGKEKDNRFRYYQQLWRLYSKRFKYGRK